MNKTSLLTILLSLGIVLHILDATFNTWAILASALSCSITFDWKICIEIHISLRVDLRFSIRVQWLHSLLQQKASIK